MPKPYQSRAEYYYGALTEGYDGELPKPQSREDYYLLKLIEKMGNISSKSVMTPRGSVTFATLPSPDKAELGDYYNVSDSFTTTSNFIEGAGHRNEAGTNVGLVLDSDGNKKWDCFGMNFTVTDKIYSKKNYHDPMSPSAILNTAATSGLLIPRGGTTELDNTSWFDTLSSTKWPGTVWIGFNSANTSAYSLSEYEYVLSRSVILELGLGTLKIDTATERIPPSTGADILQDSFIAGSDITLYVRKGSVTTHTVCVGFGNSVGAREYNCVFGRDIDITSGGVIAVGRDLNLNGSTALDSDVTMYGCHSDSVASLYGSWNDVAGPSKTVISCGSGTDDDDNKSINGLIMGPKGISIDDRLLKDVSGNTDTYEYQSLVVRPYKATYGDGSSKTRYVLSLLSASSLNDYTVSTNEYIALAPVGNVSDSTRLMCFPKDIPVPLGTKKANGGVRIVLAGPWSKDEPNMSASTLYNVGLFIGSDGDIYVGKGNSHAGISWTQLVTADGVVASAQKLNPGAKINGKTFDGSKDISIGLPDSVWETGSEGDSVTPPNNSTYVESNAQNFAMLVEGTDFHEVVGTIKTKTGVTIPKGSILLYTTWSENGGAFNRSMAPRRETVVTCMCEHGVAGHLVFSTRTLTPNDVARFYPSNDFVPGDTIRYNYFQVRNVVNKRDGDTGEFITLT